MKFVPHRTTTLATTMFDRNPHGWPFMAARAVHIHKDGIYRDYEATKPLGDAFAKSLSYLEAIRAALEVSGEQKRLVLRQTLEDTLIRAVFGSNKIESAGLGFEATEFLCRRLLSGQNIDEDQDLEAALCVDPTLRQQIRSELMRGRREVMQHMKAYLHIIQAFSVTDAPMTEGLIKNTHQILCDNIPVLHRQGPPTEAKDYAGVYRRVVVGAGSTNFVVPTSVPAKMREMCKSLEQDMARARCSVDPFSLAAKYSLEFVQIHPFLDGNGRMCRIILNAILFRFLGIFAVIGEDDLDKEEYLGIKRRSSEMMEGHGEYATFVVCKAAKSLRKVKQKLNGKRG